MSMVQKQTDWVYFQGIKGILINPFKNAHTVNVHLASDIRWNMYDLGHLSSPKNFFFCWKPFLIRIEVKNQQVNNSKPEDTKSHPAPPPASRHPAGPGLILWTADSRSASAADCLLLRPRKAQEARSLDHSEQRHGHGDTWKLTVHIILSQAYTSVFMSWTET